MPGITTIVKTKVMPATKEHNSADEIKDISKIFTLFPLHSYPKLNPYCIWVSEYLFLVCSKYVVNFSLNFSQFSS